MLPICIKNYFYFAAMFGFLKKLFGPGVDLKAKMAEGAIILDVRSAGEYSRGHVKNSKNIPLDKINTKLETIKKWNKPVIACCASGMRSGSAVSILKSNVIEAYNAGSWQAAKRLV